MRVEISWEVGEKKTHNLESNRRMLLKGQNGAALQFYRGFDIRVTMVGISSRRKPSGEVFVLLCFGFIFKMPVGILLNPQIVTFPSLAS